MVIINAEPWTPHDEKSYNQPQPEGGPKLKKEMFSIHDLANDYVQTFSEERRPRICKIIWSVIIVTVMSVSVYMVYKLVQDYVQFKSFNKSTTVWLENIALPSITICSTNYVNNTAFRESLATNESHLEGYFNRYLRDVAHFNKRGDILRNINLTEARDLIAWEKEQGLVNLRFGNQFSSLLVGEYDFEFQGAGRTIWNMDKKEMPTELGMCLEMNDKGSLVQTVGGVDGGLTFNLDATVADYLVSTKTKGFVVFVRDQDEIVMYNQGGYVIAPGTEAFIKLNAKKINRLGGKYGTCENNKSQYSRFNIHFETVRECVQKHKISMALKHCGCIPWYVAERLYKTNKTETLEEFIEEIDRWAVEGEQRRRRRDASGGNHGEETFQEFLERSEREVEQDSVSTTDSPPTTTVYTTTGETVTDWDKTPREPLFDTPYVDNVCGYVMQTVCGRRRGPGTPFNVQ
eukprot:sb/3464502/